MINILVIMHAKQGKWFDTLHSIQIDLIDPFKLNFFCSMWSSKRCSLNNSQIIIVSVTSREEHEHSHRHPKTAVEKLSVPGEQSSLPRTASPKTPDMHPRNRSRTPSSSSHHRVPENASRSLSPPDLRYLLLWLCAFLICEWECKSIKISMYIIFGNIWFFNN